MTAWAVLLLAVVALIIGAAACDAARGDRSWSDWWDSSR